MDGDFRAILSNYSCEMHGEWRFWQYLILSLCFALYYRTVLRFQQLYDIFPLKDVKYGEVYNRYMIGNVLCILARAKLVVVGDQEEDNTEPPLPALEGFPASPLASWKEDDWDMFSGYLTAIAENLKRKDVDADAPTDPEDAEIGEGNGDHELFTVRVDKILRYIKVYRAICPIREKLTDQISNEDTLDEDYPKIHRKQVEKLW
jgi:hypothetical protein